MHSDDPLRKALGDIRGWAAKGEARELGGKLGMELPEDADFVSLAEETPGVDAEQPVEDSQDASVSIDAEGVDPSQLEDLLRALTAGG